MVISNSIQINHSIKITNHNKHNISKEFCKPHKIWNQEKEDSLSKSIEKPILSMKRTSPSDYKISIKGILIPDSGLNWQSKKTMVLSFKGIDFAFMACCIFSVDAPG